MQATRRSPACRLSSLFACLPRYGPSAPGTTRQGSKAKSARNGTNPALLGDRIVRTDVVLTGGLTPAGELLPVGALAQKALAAKRGNAQHLVAPAANEADVQKIPERQRQGLEFVLAPSVGEALPAALAKHPVKGYSPP